MKKILILLFFVFFAVNFIPAVFAADKYTVRQRFGAGGVGWPHTIDELPWQNLDIGWYHDWYNEGGPRNGLEYMGMAGGYTTSYPDSSLAASCQSLKTQILTSSWKYPNGMMWTIGNEIGWDVEMGPLTAATHFEKWRDCLKSINPTFQVGTGAIAGLWIKLATETTPHDPSTCTSLTDPASGRSYFEKYLEKIINDTNGDQTKYPDLVVTHAYPNCVEWNTASVHIIVDEVRKIMKTHGMQNKDLVIKEWGDNRTNITYDTRVNFLTDSSNFFFTEKDTDLGNPDDNYRMVQRWAWFILNIWPNFPDHLPAWKPFQLIDTYNFSSNYPLTTLGQRYRDIISTNRSPVSPIQGDFNNDNHVDIFDLRQILSVFTSIFDYNQLVGNFGQPSP
ncbi:MAG: hypothetical protein V1858_02245 [Candidatus Gottesmanbacteria bacterium]